MHFHTSGLHEQTEERRGLNTQENGASEGLGDRAKRENLFLIYGEIDYNEYKFLFAYFVVLRTGAKASRQPSTLTLRCPNHKWLIHSKKEKKMSKSHPQQW